MAAGLVVAGAFVVGALFDAARQVVEIASDDTKSWSDFSVTRSLKAGAIGAGVAVAAIAAVAVLAVAGVPLAAATAAVGTGVGIGFGIVGLKSAYDEAMQGNYALAAFDAAGAILSFLGARSAYKGRLTPEAIQENPKQLSDGGLGGRKQLNAAPKEVIDPPQQTRFIGQKEGSPKDLSTGRGNLNSVGKQSKPIELKPWDRFEELATDPQRGIKDIPSVGEAMSILDAESAGFVSGARRPNLKAGEPNLDFKIDGGYADIKTPVSPSPKNPLLKQATNISRKINLYDKDVKAIIDLKNLNTIEKSQFEQHLNDIGTDMKRVNFVNR